MLVDRIVVVHVVDQTRCQCMLVRILVDFMEGLVVVGSSLGSI